MQLHFIAGKTYFGENASAPGSSLGNGSWLEENNTLYKKFVFKNFSEAFAFMTRVAIEAEKMDHHPRWTNVWNTVEVWLNTHSAGNVVTEKDRKLSKKIDSLIPPF
jgi:4a-hydroxytetrahydrobiopterin dehydratase